MTDTQTRTVHLALYPSLADWEIGHLTARIANPLWQASPGRFEVTTVAASLDPVLTMGGLTVVPDRTFADLTPADSALLVLPGSDLWDTSPGDPATAPALTAAEAFLDAGVPVAAICGATAGLARVGLLDDRNHTSAAPEYLQYTGGAYAGADRYCNEAVVNDRGLITAGPAQPVEFARAVFEELGLFTPEVLDAWYRVFGLQDMAAYGELAAAA